MTGDGDDDVIVYHRDPAPRDEILVFKGGPGFKSKGIDEADIVLTGQPSVTGFENLPPFARSMAVGDLTGDGAAEIVALTPFINQGTTSFPGRIYIFSGGPGLASGTAGGADVIFTGFTDPDFMLLEEIAIGDLSDDGKAEMVVRTLADVRVYTFPRPVKAESLANAQRIIRPENGNTGFGNRIEFGGPYRERGGTLLISAPRDATEGANAGAVYVIHTDGPLLLPVRADAADLVIRGRAGERLGAAGGF